MSPAPAMLAVALLAAPSAGRAPDPARWTRAAPGLEFRTMDGTGVCRRGSPAVAVARIDPGRWRLEPFVESQEGRGPDQTRPAGRDIDRWQKATGAALVFNAGQYRPDRVPMGLFIKDGRNLGSPRVKAWKGILAAEPAVARRTRRLPRATILDLDHEAFDPAAGPWRVAVQSFMLLDRDGGKRVRRSDWIANRTVVATDRRGRLLVLHTEGGWSLWDLADWIARSDLQVRQAMSMDGGFESQFCLRAGRIEYLSYGQWVIDDRGDRSMADLRVTLPAVIGLFPRK